MTVFIPVGRVAEEMAVTRQTVMNWINRGTRAGGKLRGFKVGGRYYTTPEDLRAFAIRIDDGAAAKPTAGSSRQAKFLAAHKS